MTQELLDWPEYCVDHRDTPAISTCTQCGAFICRDCRLVDRQGLAYCVSCEEQSATERARSNLSILGVLGLFFKTARAALLQPGHFVREMNLKNRLGPALAFGLVCATIGQLALPIWALVLNSAGYEEFVATSAENWGVSSQKFQLLVYTLMPFASLVLVTCYAFLLRLGIALAGVRTAYTYRDYLLLVSFASAGYLLRMIPMVIGLALSITFFVAFCAYALWYHHGLNRTRAFIASAPLIVAVFLLELGGGF